MSTTFANPFTEQINEQISLSGNASNRLVIAHANPDLVTRLDDAFPDTPLLDCAQSEWCLEAGELVEAIVQAATNGVCEIVIAGDSLAFSAGDEDSYDTESTQVGVGLLDGVKRAGTERAAASEHFATQVQSLLSHPEVAKRLASGKLSITTLFYRGEADLFLIYDSKTESFHPLA